MLTVCRFETLVTGLNLLKQFEFHVKAPLTAHICSASRGVPPPPAPRLCWKTLGAMGAVARVWELGMLEKGRESWGVEEGEEKERREALRSGEVRHCQS